MNLTGQRDPAAVDHHGDRAGTAAGPPTGTTPRAATEPGRVCWCLAARFYAHSWAAQ